MLAKVAVSKKPVRHEDYNQSTERYYETHVFSPKKGHIALLLNDISERKKLDLNLKYQKELLESVIENMHDALAVYDKKGSIILIMLNVVNYILTLILGLNLVLFIMGFITLIT